LHLHNRAYFGIHWHGFTKIQSAARVAVYLWSYDIQLKKPDEQSERLEHTRIGLTWYR